MLACTHVHTLTSTCTDHIQLSVLSDGVRQLLQKGQLTQGVDPTSGEPLPYHFKRHKLEVINFLENLFLRESPYVTQAGPELSILLSQHQVLGLQLWLPTTVYAFSLHLNVCDLCIQLYACMYVQDPVLPWGVVVTTLPLTTEAESLH